LKTYGTGAVMAVPAHDERDFAFAQQFGLAIDVVVEPPDWDGEALQAAHTGPGKMRHSGPFDAARAPDSIPDVIAWLDSKRIGKAQTITACAIGCSAANATGVVPSPSSTALCMGRFRCPTQSSP
jgi:leucyl-tRNA synthetase